MGGLEKERSTHPFYVATSSSGGGGSVPFHANWLRETVFHYNYITMLLFPHPSVIVVVAVVGHIIMI
jgi:hypothetical protein